MVDQLQQHQTHQQTSAQHRVARRLALLGVTATLLACGQKGPLYLPDPVPQPAVVTPAPETEEPTTTPANSASESHAPRQTAVPQTQVTD